MSLVIVGVLEMWMQMGLAKSHNLSSLISDNHAPSSSIQHKRIKKIQCKYKNVDNGNPYIPTKDDICKNALSQGIKLELRTWGPYFSVEGTGLADGNEIGRANGFITAWFGVKGRILHLETIRMTKHAFKSQNSIFGSGLLLGAMAVRHGYDCNCSKAELLAVNDSPFYYSRLVRFYTRMGFNTVYEVTGSSWRDIVHMLIWGAVGTRMDANILDLLVKWSAKFKHLD